METVDIKNVVKEFCISARIIAETLKKEGNKRGIIVVNPSTDGSGMNISRDLYNILISEKERAYSFIAVDIAKQCRDCIPLLRKPSVYFLMKDSNIVYVGKSENPMARIGQHTDSDKEFNGVALFTVDRQDLSIAENVNILHHSPLYNKTAPAQEVFASIVASAVGEYDRLLA